MMSVDMVSELVRLEHTLHENPPPLRQEAIRGKEDVAVGLLVLISDAMTHTVVILFELFHSLLKSP